MGKKRRTLEIGGAGHGGAAGYSIFVKDCSADPDVEKVVLFYQTWGIAEVPETWRSIDEPEPPTEAELYDIRNGLGRYWSPFRGLRVKPRGHPDLAILIDMELEVERGLAAQIAIALAGLEILSKKG